MNKTFWQEIIKNDCALPDGYTIEDLTPQLLNLLGSPDPELRDDIAYLIFARWIARDKHYTVDEIRNLITHLTRNLRENIGEQGTDSVLLRSFSALTLSIIAYHDAREQILADNDVHSLLDSALEYLNAEQDLRGYVPKTGWHHALAHTADLLKFLVRNPKTAHDDHSKILSAIQKKLTAPVEYVYVHDEDERLTLTMFDILRRDTISQETWHQWLKSFATWKEETVKSEGFVPTIHAPYQNCKAFLRSLYFTLRAIVDEGQDLGAAHEHATLLLPEMHNTVRAFGMGTIYGQ